MGRPAAGPGATCAPARRWGARAGVRAGARTGMGGRGGGRGQGRGGRRRRRCRRRGPGSRAASGRRGDRSRGRGCRHQPHRGQVDDLTRSLLGDLLDLGHGPHVDDDAVADQVVPAASLLTPVHHRGPGQRRDPDAGGGQGRDTEDRGAQQRPTGPDRGAALGADEPEVEQRLARGRAGQAQEQGGAEPDEDHGARHERDAADEVAGLDQVAVGDVGRGRVETPGEHPVDDEGVEASVELGRGVRRRLGRRRLAHGCAISRVRGS